MCERASLCESKQVSVCERACVYWSSFCVCLHVCLFTPRLIVCVHRLHKQDVSGNPRAMMKLMNSADVAKHSLSTLGSSNCFVDSLYDGMDFDCNVSR